MLSKLSSHRFYLSLIEVDTFGVSTQVILRDFICALGYSHDLTGSSYCRLRLRSGINPPFWSFDRIFPRDLAKSQFSGQSSGAVAPFAEPLV
ncbi:hypothetical protein PhaeoP57_01565 [Phaeobacter inhibens]|nr:hypothetical protein PhaeoP51_01605 [Phaeobacter inhibens]AUQ82499.1 hypothetical protein PhaeoP57_01565 [Phaeobacter inhibens]AUQ90260.1 hypothetical protein PhaeoP24_01639 [Phaeobacter inhibens]